MTTSFSADYAWIDDELVPNARIEVHGGRISKVDASGTLRGDVHYGRRALFPGCVNSHSHAFQRSLRGHTQRSGPGDDSFWTWRDVMYRVASRLDPDSIYAVSLQMFVEMVLAGTTAVGEFHYVHHQPDGARYRNPNELGLAVVAAAQAAGIRIQLLDVVYLRGDFDSEPSGLQLRFCDRDFNEAAERLDYLRTAIANLGDEKVGFGVAAHSIRAVPIEAIVALRTRFAASPFHMHISEQPREVEGCIRVYGAPPVELVAGAGILDGGTTLVHATHLRAGEVQAIAKAGSTVCFCPSTEADLGDGIGSAEKLFRAGVPLCLGTDGQTLSSIVEEARRLEMHERLRSGRRNVLVDGPHSPNEISLWDAATHNGARSVGLKSGRLSPGYLADWFTVDLDDRSVVGADASALPSAVLFSAGDSAIRDVVVGGKTVVENGIHPLAGSAARGFASVLPNLL